jgi:hypothetical protein
MARSRLINPTNDVINDGGTILWSFVKGEQLEYPVDLDIITDASLGYTYEAVVIEADNEVAQDTRPTTIKPGGVTTNINVRVPALIGIWNSTTGYNQGQMVSYNNKFYELLSGTARVSAITPDLDPLWIESQRNTVHLQFPDTLANDWSVQPEVGSSVYGFFELRVTEPTNPVFRRTWKPVRGMVQILFSPTDVTLDI